MNKTITLFTFILIALKSLFLFNLYQKLNATKQAAISKVNFGHNNQIKNRNNQVIIYGFNPINYSSQLDKIKCQYTIIQTQPTLIIAACLESISNIIDLIPNELQYRICFDVYIPNGPA